MLKRFGLRFVVWLCLADLALTTFALLLSGTFRIWTPWGADLDLNKVTLNARGGLFMIKGGYLYFANMMGQEIPKFYKYKIVEE